MGMIVGSPFLAGGVHLWVRGNRHLRANQEAGFAVVPTPHGAKVVARF